MNAASVTERWAAPQAPHGVSAHAAPRVGAAPIDVRVVSAHELPADWNAAWDDLALHAAEPNAFAERWFMQPALAHLGAEEPVQMLGVWEEGDGSQKLLGLIALEIGRGYARMPVRHVRNWLHFHCFLGTPLVRAGYEEVFWAATLAALDEAPWASGFLHLNGLVEDGPVNAGLNAAAGLVRRSCDIVHRTERALLESALSPQAYYETTVRKKKRKEINRLSSRLAELGTVTTATLERADQLESWCDAFLALEGAGWKGRAGSALGCAPETGRFLREVVAGAFAAGRLDFLRLDLEGRPIAMLVNFMTPPGSFSFKIAFDEEFARFSPGVLLQIENLRVLAHDAVRWMDSCAVENHPMINSLWAERRAIVRLTLPLSGLRRRALFGLCRFAERTSARVRNLRTKPTSTLPSQDE